MVIRNWFSFFIVMCFMPMLVAAVNPDAFFIIMSMTVFLVSFKCMKRMLYITFFYGRSLTAESAIPIHEKNKRAKNLDYAVVIALNLLVIIFFVYTFFISENIVLRVLSVFITANWIYDMLTTVENIFNPSRLHDIDDIYTWKDRVREIFIWVHNVSSIGFVFVMFVCKFFM